MSRGANVTGGPISRLFLAVISSCLRALPQALGAYAFTGGSLFTTLAACSIVRVVVHFCRQFLAPFAVSFLSFYSHSRGHGQFKHYKSCRYKGHGHRNSTSAGPGPKHRVQRLTLFVITARSDQGISFHPHSTIPVCPFFFAWELWPWALLVPPLAG
jgi:hypothetical protein